MIEIPLTQGQVALVDDEDYERVKRHKWSARWCKTARYYVAMTNMRDGDRYRTVYLHRFLLNASPDVEVDHIDHNGLNCSRRNIRLCTQTQNRCNRLKRTNRTTSRFKGVRWRKDNQKWQARITVEGRVVCLGSFIDEREAAQAYDRAAVAHFGEFALTNFAEAA